MMPKEVDFRKAESMIQSKIAVSKGEGKTNDPGSAGACQ